jgi:hypothetical protein
MSQPNHNRQEDNAELLKITWEKDVEIEKLTREIRH